MIRSFTFWLKDGVFSSKDGVTENFEFKGLSGRCFLTSKGLSLDCYMDDCRAVPLDFVYLLLDLVITHLNYRVKSNTYKLYSNKNGVFLCLGQKVKRRFPFLKQYKINNTWGIRCYNRKYDNAMCIEVFMLQVPWEEVVDEFISHDKDEANAKFKEFVAKYKDLEVS